jgi:hypothetical protein
MQAASIHPLLAAARVGRLDALKQQLGDMGDGFNSITDQVTWTLLSVLHTTRSAPACTPVVHASQLLGCGQSERHGVRHPAAR